MPDGESEVRQLLVGTRYLHSKFGVDVHVGWNPDSFGYNWQLPQVYKKSGISYFLTQKMVENEVNQLPLKLFWWQAPDGSRVLTYIPHDYVLEIEPTEIAGDLARAVTLNPVRAKCCTSSAPATAGSQSGRRERSSTAEYIGSNQRESFQKCSSELLNPSSPAQLRRSRPILRHGITASRREGIFPCRRRLQAR